MFKTVVAASALLALGATSAMAEVYTVREAQSRYIACYDRVYVPATIEVNTRGERVREASEAWETGSSQWNRVRNPGVYIQTRRVIEEDHYTLVRRSCPR